jgi:hypothetical protein
MLKITFTVAVIALLLLLPLRFAISSGGFFRDGIIEGLQSCKKDSDCIWAQKECCGCDLGGSEMLINKDKEFLFKLLIKDICIGEVSCVGEYNCHDEDVFCDRTCKFGQKTYTRPLLAP